MADVEAGWGSAGWYADPWGLAQWRYFDGAVWTGWTAPPAVAPYYVGAHLARQSARPPAAPRPEPVPGNQRRRLLAELFLVLAVFPLPYALGAILDLVAAVLGKGSGQRTPVLIGGHAAASFPFEVIEVLLPLTAAGLVWYLLSIEGAFGSSWTGRGEGGFRAIGLDFSWLRGDLALVLAVFALCELVPIFGGSLVLHAAGVRGIAPSTSGQPRYYESLDFLNAFVSGTVEEIVVLGFLVRRLEQLRIPGWGVVVIAVAVRGSYHLYYGWGVLPILLWAAVTALLYLRYRRLLPFIVVHIIWDGSLFALVALGGRVGGIFLVVEALVLIPVTLIFFLMWKDFIPRPIRHRPDAAALPSS